MKPASRTDEEPGRPLETLPRGARVLILRLRSLGDCVLTTPALAILRAARPELQVAVAVEDRFAAVFEGNPNVDAILPPSAAAVRRWRADLCINLHGGPRSRALAAISGARIRAGFAHYRGVSADNLRIPRAQEILGVDRKVHTAEHLASAIFHLGAPRAEIPPAKLYANPPRDARPYAVLHPMASAPLKTWPAARFRDLAARLEKDAALEVVFLAGPGEDAGAFARCRVLAGAPLAEVKNLIAGASLFIGNDSGPAHMAAALGVPAVVLFAASDPVVWAPWKAWAEQIVAGDISAISVDDVAAAAERLRVRA
jgi:heptosyltransferase-3